MAKNHQQKKAWLLLEDHLLNCSNYTRRKVITFVSKYCEMLNIIEKTLDRDTRIMMYNLLRNHSLIQADKYYKKYLNEHYYDYLQNTISTFYKEKLRNELNINTNS